MSGKSSDKLQKGLRAKEISMIALGGAMGTGIFLAMGNTIKDGGVGYAALGYALMGIIVYFVCTSLGEMATLSPDSGSVGSYGARFIDPALGFALSWDYWFNKTVAIATEMVAGTMIMKFWFPHISSILASAIFLILIVAFNLLSSKLYGITEYWFTAIKLVTVIVFIIIGILMIVGILGKEKIGISNYFLDGGPFIGGFKSLFNIFLIAGLSFVGTELVGVAAGESENPKKEIPKAINMTFRRIYILYLGTILIVGAVIPPSQAGVNTSIFTLVFENLGIPGAASIINIIILSSVLSAANSDMYASSRLLYSMAENKHAPKIFAKLNKKGIPIYGILLAIVISALCFLTGIYAEDTVYMWLIVLSSISGFIGWFGISLSHYRFRKAYVVQGNKIKDLPYRAKLFPFGVVLSIISLIIVIIGQGYIYIQQDNISGFIAAYSGIVIFILLWLGYKVKYKTKVIKLKDIKLEN